MPKLSVAQVKEWLPKVLSDVEVVEGDGDTDVDLDALAQSVYENIPAEIKTSMEEDARKSGTALVVGSMRSIASRTYGIPKKDLESLDLQGIADAIKAHTAKGNKGDTDYEARLEALQADFDAQLAEKETAWQTEKAELTTQVESAQKKFDDRDHNGHIRGFLEKMPRAGGNLDRQTLAVRSLLESEGFEFKKGANNSTEFWKDGKLQKTEEILKTYASDIIPIAKDTSHIRPSDVNGKDKIPGIQQDQPAKTEQQKVLEEVQQWANQDA